MKRQSTVSVVSTDNSSSVRRGSNSSLCRYSTFSLGLDVLSDKASIYVVNQDGTEINLSDVDFSKIKELGQGQQGMDYAAIISFINHEREVEIRYCVLKYISPKNNINSEPFEVHRKVTENDETSLNHKVLKIIQVVEDRHNNKYALMPYCDFFLNNVIHQLKLLSTTNSIECERLQVMR